jgi:tight adherence protein B
MGALLGLLLGVGLLLVWEWSQGPRPARSVRAGRPTDRLAELIARAGIESVSPGALLASCLGCGVVVGLLFLGVSRTLTVAIAFALFAGYLPLALVRYRARKRREELRELWPDAVDNLASAVRAGLSLPEALSQLGERGPAALRRSFLRFGEDYRATGRFGESLDRLKVSLADPTGDRIVESLRIAREVGGGDLGRLLRTLSAFLREDNRTRSELVTRQGWTVNGARLAVAAPWVVLALLALSTPAVQAYDDPRGAFVLAGGGAVCVVAYRLMLRIGRLPEEQRVLR